MTACNKLMESLDCDDYGSLLNNLKVRTTELEAAAKAEEGNLLTSESGEVQAALIGK